MEEMFNMEAVALMSEKSFVESCFTLQSIKAMGLEQGTKTLKAIHKKALKQNGKSKDVE